MYPNPLVLPVAILPHMLDDMRKYVRAGLEAAAGQVPDEMTGALFARAAGMAEQLSALASGFMQWSAEARASLLSEARQLIAGQVEEMGLATKQEVERLRRRIGELEEGLEEARKAGRGRSTAKLSTAKASTARGSGGPSPTAKRSTAKRSTAKRPTAKLSTAKGSARSGSADRGSGKTSSAKRATASRGTRSSRDTTSG